MNNGPLGGPTNRGLGGAAGHHGRCQRIPGIATHDDPHHSTVLQHAAQAAHHLATAVGAIGTNSAIGGLLGRESFSAGVAFGMVRNLAVSVHQLGDLLKMFAMAEYDESQRGGSFLKRFERSMMLGPVGASANVTMMSLAHFWPGFDRAAEDARDQRDALIQLVGYAFEHPGEVLKTIGDSQAKKYEEFKADLERHSMAGDFHAGDLFGELLLDVLMVIDGVAAIAKIVAKIPRLVELLPKLNELAPALRDAFKKPGIVKSPYAEGPKPEPLKRSSPPSSLPDERDFTSAEKGVYGEAQSDIYMQEDGFQKLNGDIVKPEDAPLGKGIDGVWRNTNPPPEYVVTESKYGSSGLSTLKDGTKQMSDDWVDARLNQAVGTQTADEIRDADARGQVEKWLLNVSENGNVTKSTIPGG
jgi:hypothetical protein